MIFRSNERMTSGQEEQRARRDEVLAAADRTFGGHPEAIHGNHVIVAGTTYVYEPSGSPAFVLLPECDRCGAAELDQFPLEEWNIDGVQVRGQARLTCRDCRFLELASAPADPKVQTTLAPTRIRRRTRRYRSEERLAS